MSRNQYVVVYDTYKQPSWITILADSFTVNSEGKEDYIEFWIDDVVEAVVNMQDIKLVARNYPLEEMDGRETRFSDGFFGPPIEEVPDMVLPGYDGSKGEENG